MYREAPLQQHKIKLSYLWVPKGIKEDNFTLLDQMKS